MNCVDDDRYPCTCKPFNKGDVGYSPSGDEVVILEQVNSTVWYATQDGGRACCSPCKMNARVKKFQPTNTIKPQLAPLYRAATEPCSNKEDIMSLLPEYTGGSVNYYAVDVKNPTSGGQGYKAECNDIIESLGMNYAEGNAFKALWRRAAHRTLGKHKKGHPSDGLYDAEKVEFFGARLVAQSKELING